MQRCQNDISLILGAREDFPYYLLLLRRVRHFIGIENVAGGDIERNLLRSKR
jgi:hypothetical protein